MNGVDHTALLDAPTMESAVAQHSEIVSAAQAGSPEAFAELHATYSRRLFKIIVGITRNPEDAEDALQDTFLRAHLALHTFQGRSNIYSWLTRIAINSALMVLRKRRSRPEMLFDSQPDADSETLRFTVKDSAPNPEEVYDRRQLRLRVLRAIRNLNPHLREPIRLKMMQGFSVKEIGHALHISEPAVKTRLHRARLHLSASREIKRLAPHRHNPLSAIAKSGALLPANDRSRCVANM